MPGVCDKVGWPQYPYAVADVVFCGKGTKMSRNIPLCMLPEDADRDLKLDQTCDSAGLDTVVDAGTAQWSNNFGCGENARCVLGNCICATPSAVAGGMMKDASGARCAGWKRHFARSAVENAIAALVWKRGEEKIQEAERRAGMGAVPGAPGGSVVAPNVSEFFREHVAGDVAPGQNFSLPRSKLVDGSVCQKFPALDFGSCKSDLSEEVWGELEGKGEALGWDFEKVIEEFVGRMEQGLSGGASSGADPVLLAQESEMLQRRQELYEGEKTGAKTPAPTRTTPLLKVATTLLAESARTLLSTSAEDRALNTQLASLFDDAAHLAYTRGSSCSFFACGTKRGLTDCRESHCYCAQGWEQDLSVKSGGMCKKDGAGPRGVPQATTEAQCDALGAGTGLGAKCDALGAQCDALGLKKSGYSTSGVFAPSWDAVDGCYCPDVTSADGAAGRGKSLRPSSW